MKLVQSLAKIKVKTKAWILILSLGLLGCQRDEVEVVSHHSSSEKKLELRRKIHLKAKQGHQALSYKELWAALRKTDGQGDEVKLIYLRELRGKNQNGGGKGEWNREHVWAKTYGIYKRGADYTDLHNVYPSDVRTNQLRDRKFFDEESDKDSWLPPAEIRGDIARAMFYMDVRYDGSDRYTKDLKLTNSPNAEKAEFGKLSVLLKWHQQDPVDKTERKRNGWVKKIQGNSNPFVDQPELVGVLFNRSED